MRVYRGSCHCGRIAFQCQGELDRVTICGCAICSKQGYMHWLVQRADFQLLTAAKNLSTYSFTGARGRHHFCSVCGTSPFMMPRAHPGSVDVNVRCVENVDFSSLRIEYLDARERKPASPWKSDDANA